LAKFILGDPGAASLFERQKSPWELTLTEPVPEIFEFVLLIGQKNDFFFVFISVWTLRVTGST